MDERTATTPPRRTMAAGHVLVTTVVALLVAAVLNAPALERTARGLREGLERDIATALVRPLGSLSSALRLDRPRLALDRLLGRGPAPTSAPVAAPEQPVLPEPAAPVDLRPTREDPADTWIIGDSLVELLGPHLELRIERTEAVEAEVDFRFISGLMRPEYFDWPAHIRSRMASDPPDVVVAMFGGNDGQSIELDGTVYEKWTDPWWRLYRGRVAEAMDTLRGVGRAYWIGLPVMKSDTFTEHAKDMNRVYRQEAEKRPWMRFVDTWDVFVDASGRYADYLPDASGKLELMRYQDGVHFTPQGAVRLARHVLGVISEDLRLPDPPS